MKIVLQLMGVLLVSTFWPANAQPPGASTPLSLVDKGHTTHKPTFSPVDLMQLHLARDYQLKGDLSQAEAHLHALSKRGALGIEGVILLGDIARERGDWTVAADHFVNAIDIDPDRADLYLRLGQALESMKRYDDADVAFARFTALHTVGDGK